MEIISKPLLEMDLSLDSVAAQCYDGAPVMSGERCGLQTLFCAACGRYILYVHCYCHRLHLVVTEILDSLQDMKSHYSILSKLYNFFKILAVKRSFFVLFLFIQNNKLQTQIQLQTWTDKKT